MLQFAELFSRNKEPSFLIWRFINAFMLSHLNSVSSRYLQVWLFDAIQNILTNHLQDYWKIKYNVTIILQMRHTIFQYLRF